MKRDLKQLGALVDRNIKLYFNDKLLFFVSLLTPLILVVLFLTFLQGIYEDTLLNSLKDFVPSSQIVNGFTGGWLFSSIMATSVITVSFCSNMMVNDKLTKSVVDLRISPTKTSIISTSYVISNFITSFIVCFVLLVISLIYLGVVGFYLSFLDIVLIIVDMVLSILFGTLLANIVAIFINSQGALSAVSTMVSSMYGFICGAYMPISQMGEGMQSFTSFIPGTYGTVLFRQYYLDGLLKEMGKSIPAEAISEIRKSFDGTFYFFGTEVMPWVMYLILIGSICVAFVIYILLVNLKNKNKLRFNIKNKAKAK